MSYNDKDPGKIVAYIHEHYPEATWAKGFDDCIIGISSKGKIVYSQVHIINKLVRRDKMEWDEAIEFFHYNIEGAYVGENTPLYMEML